MLDERKEKERSYNILVYGIEKRGLSAPSSPLQKRNFSISFASVDTSPCFNEYDGVILFQGIFEQFEYKEGIYGDGYYRHSCDGNELDKRKKEAQLLLEKGGFLCFLLNERFIDSTGGRDYEGSDLAKYYLNYPQFYRKNFGGRVTHLDIKSDDFCQFLKKFGAASSYFRSLNKKLELRVLAEAANETAGMIINRNMYFLPTLIPDNSQIVIEEYFTLLVECLTSSYNKLQQTLPEWIEEFSFYEEEELAADMKG